MYDPFAALKAEKKRKVFFFCCVFDYSITILIEKYENENWCEINYVLLWFLFSHYDDYDVVMIKEG